MTAERKVPLLPCPFCGADPVQHHADPLTGHIAIECPTLDCVMHVVWPGIDGWQRRAAPAAPARKWSDDEVNSIIDMVYSTHYATGQGDQRSPQDATDYERKLARVCLVIGRSAKPSLSAQGAPAAEEQK